MVSWGLETLFRKYKDMLYSIAVKMYILLYFSPITHSQTRHPHVLSHRMYAAHSPRYPTVALSRPPETAQ